MIADFIYDKVRDECPLPTKEEMRIYEWLAIDFWEFNRAEIILDNENWQKVLTLNKTVVH